MAWQWCIQEEDISYIRGEIKMSDQTTKDWYREEVIRKGDKGSKLLAKLCTAPTLDNCEYVDVIKEGMNGLAVLRVPEDYYVVVHSAGGDPEAEDLAEHASTLVDKLVDQAKSIGATPVAFADVIDSNTGDKSMLETIASALVSKANEYNLTIMNGENAILGPRINPDAQANVSGTMISLMKKEDWEKFKSKNKISADSPVSFMHRCTNYSVFDPEGKPVIINSDGVGTKTEFYERVKKYWLALRDFMAMNLDDASKSGATVMAVSGVAETKGTIPVHSLHHHADEYGKEIGIMCTLQPEEVGDRLMGYHEDAPSFNISGSVVSTIDEERLKNPLKPSEGETLIAIVREPNPRSNGISAKRRNMVARFGPDYHQTKEGKQFLEFLTRPSTILYSIFKELIDEGLATSVYHMSGGAYNGKLAKPLAEEGLFAKIENLFEPDWRELALAGFSLTSTEDAYAQWPMGNDGFISTKNPDAAIKLLEERGYQAKVVGTLEKAVGQQTGVELTACNGEEIYFSGREAA
jgi:phosphoribosylaminoimidazole (AIR) synthetase